MWSLARYWLSGPELPLQVGSCPNVTYTGLAAIMYRYSLQRHQSIPPPPEILLLITTINLHIQAFFFIFDPVKYSWFVATDGHDTPFWRPRRILGCGTGHGPRDPICRSEIYWKLLFVISLSDHFANLIFWFPQYEYNSLRNFIILITSPNHAFLLLLINLKKP